MKNATFEKVKAYAKENDISISEILYELGFDKHSRKSNVERLKKLAERDFDAVIDTIDDLHTCKATNKGKFKNCGFMRETNEGRHTDCYCLTKAHCLIKGYCNFYKTQAEIDRLTAIYGDGKDYSRWLEERLAKRNESTSNKSME